MQRTTKTPASFLRSRLFRICLTGVIILTGASGFSLYAQPDFPPDLVGQFGHFSEVSAVTISTDGQFILTGGTDGTVILWNVERGLEVRRFAGHTGKVFSVA